MQHELKSNNFVEGKSGWRMSKDGTFEVCYRAPWDNIEIHYKKAPGMEAEVTYSGVSRSQQEQERDFAVRNGYITEAMVSEAAIREDIDDPVRAFRESMLGKPFHRELDRAILDETVTRAEADSLLVSRVSLTVETPGGTVVLGDLDREDLSGQAIVDPEKFTASIKAPRLRGESLTNGMRTGRMDPIPEIMAGFKPGSVLREFSNNTAALVANATQSLEQLISHHNRMITEMEKIEGGSIDLLLMASNQFRMGEALLRELLRKVDTRDVDDGK